MAKAENITIPKHKVRLKDLFIMDCPRIDLRPNIRNFKSFKDVAIRSGQRKYGHTRNEG